MVEFAQVLQGRTFMTSFLTILLTKPHSEKASALQGKSLLSVVGWRGWGQFFSFYCRPLFIRDTKQF